MRVLITGSTGLLGQALVSRLAPSCDVTGLARHPRPGSGAGRHRVCDLLEAERVAAAMQACRPDVVLHAQALSDVDRCELEPEAARAQNVTALAHVVRALEPLGARLVFVSTDYVFDGRKGSPYDETDRPSPLSVYGRAKAEAEGLALGYPRGVVVRTSTLFGPGRMNFCDHIVAQTTAGRPVEAFVDQVTSPTYTVDLADGMAELLARLRQRSEPPSPRVLHLANAGGCSRVAFAERVAELVGASRALIRAIPMAQQRRPAARPPYSALTTIHVPPAIGRTLRPWDDALQAYLRQRRWLN